MTEAPAGHGGGFCSTARAAGAGLADKLGFYKLRAKVTVENLSGKLGVLAVWDGEPAMQAGPGLRRSAQRQRSAGAFWCRKNSSRKLPMLIGAELVDSADYEAHRIACGVPRGGLDFMYGDAFPHEANMDRLHGVDFDKGCYVGQEVVSRMQHRGTARTRIVRVVLDDGAPETGSAGDGRRQVGRHHGLVAGGQGLALLRLDRVADALDAGIAVDGGRPSDLARRRRRPRSYRRSKTVRMTQIRAPACRRPDALPVAGRRPALCRLSRHRMGRARNMTTARCSKS